MSYFSALSDAMMMLAAEPNAIFMGQGMFAGTTMSDTLKDVPAGMKLEMPVAEDLQMGMAIGMALDGLLPICIFPRWNFLLCAANQLVNHFDRLPLYSDGGYRPKVIIRTAVPSIHPFNPGPQHDDDFTAPFQMMLRTVEVYKLLSEEEVASSYAAALRSDKSSLIVEMTEHYKDERSNTRPAGSKAGAKTNVENNASHER
jgi:pyruvate/2-oxoglutarate/acetoin dehydrogenase E1 component